MCIVLLVVERVKYTTKSMIYLSRARPSKFAYLLARKSISQLFLVDDRPFSWAKSTVDIATQQMNMALANNHEKGLPENVSVGPAVLAPCLRMEFV